MSAESTLWNQCTRVLQAELPEQQFNTWIRPLHAIEKGQDLKLLAPNRFVLDWVKQHYIGNIRETVDNLSQEGPRRVDLEIGSQATTTEVVTERRAEDSRPRVDRRREKRGLPRGNLNPGFTFDSFVEGKSNQLARAASTQIGENPGSAYNPLFIYGDVGLGKTIEAGLILTPLLSSGRVRRLLILAPVLRQASGPQKRALQRLRKDGFARVPHLRNSLP